MKSAAGDDNKKEGLWSFLLQTLGSRFFQKASIKAPLPVAQVQDIETGSLQEDTLSKAEKVELAALLREHNNDIEGLTNQHETPLMRAVKVANMRAIMLLIKAGAQVNNGGCREANLLIYWSPLTIAARNGNVEIVECLIKARVDIDQKELYNRPLMEAIRNGKVEVAKILLSHKADINARVRGSTALKLAVSHQLGDVVALLIAGKADLEIRRSRGEDCVLECAAREGRPDMVKLLLRCGVGRDSATEALRETVYFTKGNRKRENPFYNAPADKICTEIATSLLASPFADYRIPSPYPIQGNYTSEQAILEMENPIIIAALNARKEQDRQRLGAELEGILNEPALVSQYRTSILAQLLGMS